MYSLAYFFFLSLNLQCSSRPSFSSRLLEFGPKTSSLLIFTFDVRSMDLAPSEPVLCQSLLLIKSSDSAPFSLHDSFISSLEVVIHHVVGCIEVDSSPRLFPFIYCSTKGFNSRKELIDWSMKFICSPMSNSVFCYPLILPIFPLLWLCFLPPSNPAGRTTC